MTPIIDAKEIEKIVLEHILKIRQLEETTGRVLRERVENLIARVLLKINQNLKGAEGIRCYDSLYCHVEDMKVAYEGFLEQLDRDFTKISDSSVKEIFSGIREMSLLFLEEIPSKGDNPITYERMVLISAAVLRIKQFWMNELENEFQECDLGNSISGDSLLRYMNRHVRSFFMNGMFTTTQILDENISLMSAYEEGRRYESLIRRQVEDLKILVIVQKDVVMAQAENPDESNRLKELLERLTGIYRMSVSALEKLDGRSKIQIASDSIINMEQIEALLETYIINDKEIIGTLLKTAEQIQSESVEELRNIIDTETGYLSTEISQRVNREASGNQLLSGQLVGLFSEAVLSLSRIEDSYLTDRGHIISEGIRTTMALKLESIREKDTDYQIGKKQLAIELEQQLMEQKRIFIEQTDQILDDFLLGSERVLNKTQKAFFDRVEGIYNKHFRYDINYMKNDLLFELRTFEELIEHSLKKLIELEPKGAKAITEVMLNIMDKSRDILASHGIELIIPSSHDRFDAKAHEVMMAESRDGFHKGEIIKCINVGYRMKEHVIIRASVLAAK